MALSETTATRKAAAVATITATTTLATTVINDTAAFAAAQDAAKELSDEDSGVEMIQEHRRSSSSSSASSSYPSLSSASAMITRKYLLQHRRRTSHPKKRGYSELRRSLCSDSSISDHERPGSHDSGVRLEAISPDGCFDLSVKVDKEPRGLSRVSCEPVATPGYTTMCHSSRSSYDDDAAMSPAKRTRIDGDSQLVRQRRMEANARERTRVHTIGAAFESLRSAIPAYSNGQKLSKLAILRVASSYILALSSLLEDQRESFEGAVEACASAIHLDSKVRRR